MIRKQWSRRQHASAYTHLPLPLVQPSSTSPLVPVCQSNPNIKSEHLAVSRSAIPPCPPDASLQQFPLTYGCQGGFPRLFSACRISCSSATSQTHIASLCRCKPEHHWREETPLSFIGFMETRHVQDVANLLASCWSSVIFSPTIYAIAIYIRIHIWSATLKPLTVGVNDVAHVATVQCSIAH